MLGGCEDGLDLVQVEVAPVLLLLLWLILFIEALVLSPNIEREGSQQRPIKKGGQLVQAILTKGGLCLPKAMVVTPSWAPR